MKGKTKRKFTADFKLKVVLEVLKEKDTLAVISKRHELHPTQISDRVGGPVESSLWTRLRPCLRLLTKLPRLRLNPTWPCFMNRLGSYKWS